MYQDLARHLRKNMTDTERCLWSELRHRQMVGCKFRRQAPIGSYIADFVCFERKLIVELDGGQHAEEIEADAKRTEWLNKEGFTVLRFWNHEVFENLHSVLEVIWRAVRSTPHPNPPPQGGREKDIDATMKRRQAFTIVELLVAMALIMFIMAVLSQAFVQATGTFRNLKATGDMAEKLRATTQQMTRDLSADHFEGKKRLSNPNFWLNGPPEQGFFQILQGSPGTAESPTGDVYGINSFVSTNHSLAFTIKLRGNQMGDFPSASSAGGGAVLSTIPTIGPPESRYQVTSGGAYNYQWAEVAWFLQPSINPTTNQQDVTVADAVAGTAPLPLWILYRRQRLLVPDNSQVPAQPAANITNFQEASCWVNGANLYFNNPIDITDPQRRFGSGVGSYSAIPQGQGALSGSDIQLTDVVSFDVRVLVQGMTGTAPDPFVTLHSVTPSYYNGNPAFYNPTNNTGPAVFDTWTSINDGLGNSYAQWNMSGQGTSIPLWNANTQSGPIILAVQISIRIWDVKTNQTRQVTIVQAM